VRVCVCVCVYVFVCVCLYRDFIGGYLRECYTKRPAGCDHLDDVRWRKAAASGKIEYEAIIPDKHSFPDFNKARAWLRLHLSCIFNASEAVR
jgi:hypothetical protein